MPNTAFDFVTTQRDIFKALLESKDKGTAVGIRALPLGKGMFITAVDDILIGDGNENTMIILRGHDFTGHVLETSVIRLDQIEGVCIFSSQFGNPILKTISRILKI